MKQLTRKFLEDYLIKEGFKETTLEEISKLPGFDIDELPDKEIKIFVKEDIIVTTFDIGWYTLMDREESDNPWIEIWNISDYNDFWFFNENVYNKKYILNDSTIIGKIDESSKDRYLFEKFEPIFME